MEFLDILETFKANDASLAKLFGGEGVGVRSRGKEPGYMAKLAEAATFVGDVMQGRRPAHQLREALTTPDFPNLFGDIIDRQLLANYRETPATFRNYCKVATVPDFRTVKRFEVNGSEAVLAVVDQQAPYPESKLTDTAYSYAVQKYGRTIPFSWETMIDDDLQALQDVPARFGKAARRSEEKFATQLFMSSTGPINTLYTAGNKNIVNITNGALQTNLNNPPLSIAAIQDALVVLANQVDNDGEPIMIDAVHLVVPPALEVVAKNILNATELATYVAGGAASEKLMVANWMRNRTSLHVNYYLPIIGTGTYVAPSGSTVIYGNTSWFLFADPNGNRPALEVGFLRGHAEPEIYYKQPNMVRVGGGAGNLMDGDFETDSIQYKVRHVFGGVIENPKMTVASTGASA